MLAATVRPRAESLEAFEREAETIRALAHPNRLRILSALTEEGRSVTDLAEELGMSLPNVSQHLRVLRDRRIVRPERRGQTVLYRLTDPAFRTCCALVRQLVLDTGTGGLGRSTVAPDLAPPGRPRPRNDGRERTQGGY